MSRTTRNLRPKMAKAVNKTGVVRDGTPQYQSSGCQHHGSCRWCAGNRTFSSRKREVGQDQD